MQWLLSFQWLSTDSCSHRFSRLAGSMFILEAMLPNTPSLPHHQQSEWLKLFLDPHNNERNPSLDATGLADHPLLILAQKHTQNLLVYNLTT